MLTREGLAIEAPDLLKRAKRELTVAPIDRSGIVQRPKCIQVWWTAGGRVHVPRFWHPAIHANTVNFGEITPIRPQFSGALKPELDQPRAVDAVLTSMRETGGAVLSLGTGQGKTTCACYVIATLGVKTIVLVHKDVLRTQWAERIAQFLPGTTVSFVQGGTCDLSGDVVVAMLQTLVGREYAFPGFGMVVVDECFPRRQTILTEDGQMEIGMIYDRWKNGQVVRVQSFNERTKAFEVRPVTHAWEKAATELIKVSYTTGNYRATSNHPVLTPDGWKATGDLVPGDLLISRDESTLQPSTLRVSTVERYAPDDTRVYDLEVEGTHTFVCASNGPVVHNCHHIAAETFSTAMRGLCCPYSLGLSATPERKDGLTRVMHWFLGPLAYAAQRDAQHHVVVHLVKYTCARYKLPPPMTRFGTVNFAAVLTDMADDRARTKAIVAEILKLRQDPERIVLVLSHRRDHCTEIAAGVPGAVAFLGGKKKKTDTSDHTTAPVVCATYSLASEGYDDPRLNALVLATPCSDVTQAAGRILRGAATKDPVIIDFQDDLSVAYAQSARRKGFYRKAGFTYAEQQRKEYAKCIIID